MKEMSFRKISFKIVILVLVIVIFIAGLLSFWNLTP